MSRFKLTAGHAADIMCNAIEGGRYGIGYWCSNAEYTDSNLRDEVSTDTGYPAYAIAEFWDRGGSMILKDAESDDRWEINLQKLQDALENENLPEPSAFRILQGNGADDANDADLIVQVAIFGEIIFG